MYSYDNLTIEKGMYGLPVSFSAVLESLDPSEQYQGSSLEGLDAYQRQLKRFDIHVSGKGSDAVEKFFRTSSSAALFPEYVARAVRQGMEEANLLPQIVATVTTIDSLDYRTIASVPSADEKELKRVNEGAYIPETTVRTKENLVKLNKRGRMLVASYEALKFQRLDLFTVTLKQIGAYIARCQLNDAINVLLNGDGNNNGISTVVGTSGSVSYADLLKLWNHIDPYSLTTIIASPKTIESILTLPEMRDSVAGLNFHGSGNMVTPLGANLIKTNAVADGTIIGLDKNCALEMVQAGDITTEYDKLIDRQLERVAITSTAGFAKIFTDASAKISY